MESGASVEIEGGDAHKIRRVLRLRDGDEIEIVDSSGTPFVAALAFDGSRVRATLGDAIAVEDDAYAVRFDVAQALPKGQKMDFVVEKITELGAHAILPFRCERSLARAATPKEERWQRLAESAARQSGRRSVPRVHATLASFSELIERFGDYDAVAFAWELAPHVPLSERLPHVLDGADRVLLVVGPEGGFTHDEAEAARARGAALVWMGPRILRTETAALALLAVADAFAQGRNCGQARRTSGG